MDAPVPVCESRAFGVAYVALPRAWLEPNGRAPCPPAGMAEVELPLDLGAHTAPHGK